MNKSTLRFVTLFTVLIMAVLPGVLAFSADNITQVSIYGVVQDQTVVIRVHNMPAELRYETWLKPSGTSSANWEKIASRYSGKGGIYLETYSLPVSVIGAAQVDIRLTRKSDQSLIASNHFYNHTNGVQPTAIPGSKYSGYPTIAIVSIDKDKQITIQAYNLPPKNTFEVRMGKMGTRGLNGLKVASFESGSGGNPLLTYAIPSALLGEKQIAIRLQSITKPEFVAFNWFYNQTQTETDPVATATPGPTSTPGPAPTVIPGYVGYPTFAISSVVRDKSVSIQTQNLPPGDSFDVLMGVFGTRAVNGIKAGAFNTGEGGKKLLSFDIPSTLKGSYQIAVRIQSASGSGYYAYNWFYNSTTP